MIKRTVLLYGQSLLLPLVAACLQKSPDLRVTHAATWAEVTRFLAERVPDVVIFDLTNSNRGRVLPLLLENPHLVLIGLDTEHNQAVLVTGQETRSLTLQGLREIVEHESHDPQGFANREPL